MKQISLNDAFRVRYAQLQDLLANKLFRSLLHLEEEKIGIPSQNLPEVPE